MHQQCNNRCESFKQAFNNGDYIKTPTGILFRFNERYEGSSDNGISWRLNTLTPHPPTYNDLADYLCYYWNIPGEEAIIVSNYQSHFPAKLIKLTLTFKEV